MERSVWNYAKRGNVDALHALLHDSSAEVGVDDMDDLGVTPLMVSAQEFDVEEYSNLLTPY